MKKMIFIVAILSIVQILAFSNGGSEKEESAMAMDKAYLIATDSTWPPMEFIDTENNEIVGFTIDMMKAIAEKEDLSIEFESTSWDGIFAGLETGKYDAIASSVTITEERKEKMFFSDPYFNAGQILVVRSEDAQKYPSLDKLEGREVGAQIGTTGAAEVTKVGGITLKTYDDLAIGIEELATGNIDGVVADTPLLAAFLLEDRYKGKLVLVGEQMTSEDYGIAVSFENEELVKSINSGLAKIKADGTYDAIYSEWIKN